MRKTRLLEFCPNIRIVVAEASVEMGNLRGLLRGQARAAFENEPPERQIAHFFSYPDCIAGTESVDGLSWPMEFDDFRDLPEVLVDDWAQAVHELNPQWARQMRLLEEDSKKAPSSPDV